MRYKIVQNRQNRIEVLNGSERLRKSDILLLTMRKEHWWYFCTWHRHQFGRYPMQETARDMLLHHEQFFGVCSANNR